MFFPSSTESKIVKYCALEAGTDMGKTLSGERNWHARMHVLLEREELLNSLGSLRS